MNYVDLNENNRKQMLGICNNDVDFQWDDDELHTILLGGLPSFYPGESYNDDMKTLIEKLTALHASYDFCKHSKEDFLFQETSIVEEIRGISPYWNRLNLFHVQKSLGLHKFCLLSGYGGVGKSYFIKQLEEKLTDKRINHLCIYGKFEKNIDRIDFDEIVSCSKDSVFVFIFDAINEISEEEQIKLYEKLKIVSEYRNVRIIISYRTYSLNLKILNSYQDLSSGQYSFEGISFESAVQEIIKIPSVNICKYEDIVFSKNALHLNLLCKILKEPKLVDETENSICTITFILEYYIKTICGRKKAKDVGSWENIKEIVKWMYANSCKEISLGEIEKIIGHNTSFLIQMQELGLMGVGNDSEKRYFFIIDSLSDFLLGREFLNDLGKEKNLDRHCKIIKEKCDKIYGIEEALILALFDRFHPDFEYIHEVLIKSGLMEFFEKETLLKIKFKNDEIVEFLKYFSASDRAEMFVYFGGYYHKPFNCEHYLNDYLLSSKTAQISNLNEKLSGKYISGRIQERLKNLLYFITVHDAVDNSDEIFYFSAWCCMSSNQNIRDLATKLLYEIVLLDDKYIDYLIDHWNSYYDIYMRESIIEVLSNIGLKDNESIDKFFQILIKDKDFICGKSLSRIFSFYDCPCDYIKETKRNLYREYSECENDDIIDEIIFEVDMFDRNLLPVYLFKDTFHTRFLSYNKDDIISMNFEINRDFSCVFENGFCCNYYRFVDNILNHYGFDMHDRFLEPMHLKNVFGKILLDIFQLYEFSYSDLRIQRYGPYDFSNSMYRKYIDIAIDMFLGSLMCNYYTEEFSFPDEYSFKMGFQEYNIFDRETILNLHTPIQTYKSDIDDMESFLVEKIELPEDKDIFWVRNDILTDQNILKVLEPIEYKGEIWVPLSGNIKIQSNYEGEIKWIDSYNFRVCTNDKKTICHCHNDRKLTIELDQYCGRLEYYLRNEEQPWFCKSVPSIKYGADIFDDIMLVLPPSELISYLDLHIDMGNMTWCNCNNEVVIVCDNNKKSYFRDLVSGASFIRKKEYDKFIEQHDLKYFAFAERYIPSTGYADESSLHYEIKNGQIIKRYLNSGYESYSSHREENEKCKECPYGFYQERDESSERIDFLNRYSFEEIEQILKDYLGEK